MRSNAFEKKLEKYLLFQKGVLSCVIFFFHPVCMVYFIDKVAKNLAENCTILLAFCLYIVLS